MQITQDELKKALSYDQYTGVFVWIKTYRNQNLGKIAGCTDPEGYVGITFKQRIWRAHHLAWLYVYGSLPKSVIDHRDGNRSNNAIDNLREVSIAGNCHNQRKAHKDSKHGYLGVDYNRSKKRFRARIQINGKRKTLGGFDTAEAAYAAYLKAKRELHGTCTI